LSGVTIAQGGVLPNIQAVLLPKKSEKTKAWAILPMLWIRCIRVSEKMDGGCDRVNICDVPL
jgi:hypothetical protein